MGQVDDRSNDRRVLLQLLDEELVYLEHVRRQPLQVGERGMAHTEVVDGNAYPRALEAVQGIGWVFRDPYIGSFGNVQAQATRLEPRLSQYPFDNLNQFG